MEDTKENSPPGHPLAPSPLPGSSGCCKSSYYLELNELGVGAFGRVARCLKQATGETVAVKTIRNTKQRIIALKEVSMLQKLRGLDPDMCHIVRFHEFFFTECGTSLVFEALDISLDDYMELREFAPLPLDDISTITQQLATALDALKSVGVIHTDLKPDNIMLVDHLRKPFKVKLIDFGLAIETSEAETGALIQPLAWRSPEVILGLPFSEAIDMWSLGCVISYLFLGMRLFPGQCEYEVMAFIVDLLGQPADHLLDAGLKTKQFFKKTPYYVCNQHWMLLTAGMLFVDTRRYKFNSLDKLKEERLDEENSANNRREFVELLKEMLQVDAGKRITPREVLAHPFITMGHPNGSRHSSHCEALRPATTVQRDSETVDKEKSQPAALEPSRNQVQARSQVQKKTKAKDCTGRTSTAPQPRVILVQPMSSMNSVQEDGATEQQSDNHQISPQTALNKTSSCPEIVDDSGIKLESVTESDMAAAGSLKLESVTESDMAAAVSLSETDMAAAVSLSETDMAAAVSLSETAMAAAVSLSETDMAAAVSLSETDMAAAVSLSETAMAAAVPLKLESLSESDMAADITEATPSLDATEVGAAAVPAVDSATVDTTSVPPSSAAAAAALNQTDHLDNESSHTTSEVSEPKKKKKKKKNGIRRFFSRIMKALRNSFVRKDNDAE